MNTETLAVISNSEMNGREFGLWSESLYSCWKEYGDAVGAEGYEFFWDWMSSMDDWYAA